jgi:hypothetical protein
MLILYFCTIIILIIKAMKTNLTLFCSFLAMGVSMIACENNDQPPKPEPIDPTVKYNDIIKSYDNAIVLKWDEALSLAVDNKMPPPAESRVYAMVTLAMHDALNNVLPKYETYALNNDGVSAADVSKADIRFIADAAVAQAAHDVLVILVPGSATDADSLLTECLAPMEESEFKSRGIQTGKDAAAAILAERQNDPPLSFLTYEQGTEPGQYRSTMPYAAANPPVWPDNSAYAPDMGAFIPFGIVTSDQFRARPPYSLDSPEYAADYDEVKRFGAEASTERTQEQTDLGQFFLDNVSNSLNRIARIMSVQDGMNGWKTAKLLAMIQMTQFDALLSSFEGKYHYNRWRPITAIRSGEDDLNPETTGDPAWSILKAARATPPTPAYPSAHAETSGAGAEIFKLFFNTDYIEFTIGSYSLPSAERSFESFSQFATECSASRIYIGYHFRDDIVQGESKGRELAKYVFENKLKDLF